MTSLRPHLQLCFMGALHLCAIIKDSQRLLKPLAGPSFSHVPPTKAPNGSHRLQIDTFSLNGGMTAEAEPISIAWATRRQLLEFPNVIWADRPGMLSFTLADTGPRAPCSTPAAPPFDFKPSKDGLAVSLERMDANIEKAIVRSNERSRDLEQRKKFWAERTASYHRRLIGCSETDLVTSPRPPHAASSWYLQDYCFRFVLCDVWSVIDSLRVKQLTFQAKSVNAVIFFLCFRWSFFVSLSLLEIKETDSGYISL